MKAWQGEGGGVKGVNWNEGQQKWEVAEFCGDLRLSAGFWCRRKLQRKWFIICKRRLKEGKVNENYEITRKFESTKRKLDMKSGQEAQK